MTIDFDTWRSEYAESSFADQADFYGEVFRAYPSQRHWNLTSFLDALTYLGSSVTRVVELGGWDGALAHAALRAFPDIVSWTNLEVCREVVEAHPGDHDAYHAVALTAHVWEDPSQVPEADLAVGTHVFEHLTLEHALLAIEALNPSRALYVEMPLSEGGQSWSGYSGSHILNVGWMRFERELAERGWTREPVPAISSCRMYRHD